MAESRFSPPKRLLRRTKRLVVRPLRAGDFRAWREAHLASSASRNDWDRSARKPEELTRARFAKLVKGANADIARDAFYDFGIFRRSDGAYLGRFAIMDVMRRFAQTAYLGYNILNPYWGRGYAKEAVSAAFELAFRDLKLHRLEAGIEPRNVRSIRLARALGMRREGCKRRMLYLRGAWRDCMMYSITVEDLGWTFRGPEPSRDGKSRPRRAGDRARGNARARASAVRGASPGRAARDRSRGKSR